MTKNQGRLWKLRKNQLVHKIQRLTLELARARKSTEIWQRNYSTMEEKWRHERQRALNEEIINDELHKRIEAST